MKLFGFVASALALKAALCATQTIYETLPAGSRLGLGFAFGMAPEAPPHHLQHEYSKICKNSLMSPESILALPIYVSFECIDNYELLMSDP